MDSNFPGERSETGLASSLSTQQTEVNKGTGFTSTASSAHILTPLKTSSKPPAMQTSPPTLSAKRSMSGLSSPRTSTPSVLRRTSSNLNPRSPSMPRQEPLTAASVAEEYFTRELRSHENIKSEVVFYVHDSCYGHRFSRPKTSKAALSTIVERPERIHATVLGAATAYVRLGQRHAEGRSPPHPDREIENDRPFVFKKTSRSIPLNHPAVVHVHGQRWMEELQVMCDTAEAKLAMTGKELSRPIGYGKDEKGNALPKLHEGDLYLCSESLAALQGCLGGVCDAVDDVLGSSNTKRAFVCIRPPGHHCSSDFPSGFCWLNNVHVGISYAAMNYGITHAAIIDFDLHHGDGSQAIAWSHNSKAQSAAKNASAQKKIPIGYYSLHDINSYPCEWGDEEKVRNASLCIENAHGQSIWNVHLEPWKSHEEFWDLYESRYTILLAKMRRFLRHHTTSMRNAGHTQPKAVIFISAGFDASEWEGEGMQRHKVNVPTDFYARFTADIVNMAAEDDLAVDGRIISVLEGGYSDRALMSGALSHACGLSSDQSDRDWWHVQQLETLEDVVAGRVRGSSTAIREHSPSHFSSPTHASTAKMTDNAKERSISAKLEKIRLDSQSHIQTYQPPPEVDWATAAFELSKLLIPTESRQTFSCRPEELNAEATRARRDRQSGVGVSGIPPAPPPEVPRMQLRDRKVSRKTIADVSELPDPTLGKEDDKVPRRRRSSASSIMSGLHDLRLHTQPTAVVPVKQPVVKKTRAPPAARQATKPVTQRTALARSDTNSSTGTRSRSHSQATLANGEKTTDGIDDIMNGMKKISIKLKVPSAEEHAAKQAGKAEADKAKKERAPKKSAVPRAPRKALTQTKAGESRTSPTKSSKAETDMSSNPSTSMPAYPMADLSKHNMPAAVQVAPDLVAQPLSAQGATTTPSTNTYNPNFTSNNDIGMFNKAAGGNDVYERSKITKTSPADVIMWSGSNDDQTSQDAKMGSEGTGVMNWTVVNGLRENPHQSYEQVSSSPHAFPQPQLPSYPHPHHQFAPAQSSETNISSYPPFLPSPYRGSETLPTKSPSVRYSPAPQYSTVYPQTARMPTSSHFEQYEPSMYPNLSSEPDFNSHLPPTPQFVVPAGLPTSQSQTPKGTKTDDLPRFTSTSPIPFSRLNGGTPQDRLSNQSTGQGGHSSMSIPETPMYGQVHSEAQIGGQDEWQNQHDSVPNDNSSPWISTSRPG